MCFREYKVTVSSGRPFWKITFAPIGLHPALITKLAMWNVRFECPVMVYKINQGQPWIDVTAKSRVSKQCATNRRLFFIAIKGHSKCTSRILNMAKDRRLAPLVEVHWNKSARITTVGAHRKLRGSFRWWPFGGTTSAEGYRSIVRVSFVRDCTWTLRNACSS